MIFASQGSAIFCCSSVSMARINAVNPGIIDTPFQDRVWGSDERKYGFANATVAGRAGRSEEVAAAVIFLASERASFFSGQGLVMDGGYVTQ